MLEISVAAMIPVRRSISRTLSRYSSILARSAGPNCAWNAFVRSRIMSSRLSDSRAFRTRSFGVVAPNSPVKIFFGFYSAGTAVLASRKDKSVVAVPEPAACWLFVSEASSRVGIAVS
jgi:hypothetical protein